MFPLSVVGADGWALADWVRDYEKHWLQAAEAGNGTEAETAKGHAENARQFGEHLKGITEKYQISYIELDQDLELAKVCDIFTQINSRGVRLDVFDLLNALLRPKGLRLRRDLWKKASPRLDFIETDRANVYVLQVMSILRQGYCSPKYLYNLIPGSRRLVRGRDGVLRSDVLVADSPSFESLWHRAVDGVGTSNQSTAPSTGIRCDLLSISALHSHSSGIRVPSSRSWAAPSRATAQSSAKDASLGIGPASSRTATRVRSNPQRPKITGKARHGLRRTALNRSWLPSFKEKLRSSISDVRLDEVPQCTTASSTY